MKYLGIALIIAVAFLAGVHVAPMTPDVAMAQRPLETPQISAPRAWGKIVGLTGGAIVFEAGDGTLRFLNINYRIDREGQVVLTITRN